MWTKNEVCNLIDLTSLQSSDSIQSIKHFLKQAQQFKQQGFSVAAVCLYPNFASLAVAQLKDSGIKVAVVSGNFPNAQGFLSTKLGECQLALDAGVDEVDVVLNLGAFEDKNYERVLGEVNAFKNLMPHKCLKVIIETGFLKTPERIQLASELAIQGGADFIKTSTGKEYTGATIEAVEVMAQVIATHYQKTNKHTGLKISGGVRTYSEALKYLETVENYLGKEFMTPNRLRIGASSLIKDLME